jgi:VWFA-related protein
MSAGNRDAAWRAAIGCMVLICGAVLATAPAFAQEETTGAPPASTPVFTEEVEVNVVNIYVTVVDRKGAPVKGLAAADFRIEEGGEPMEITNFSAIGTVEVGIAGETPATGSEPAGAAAAPAAQALPVSQVAVVFDHTGLERRQRGRVLKALVPWAGSATANGGRVMVAVLEPELKILQPLTADPSLVISALEEVDQRPAQGDMIKSSKRLLVRDIQAAQTVSMDLQPMQPPVTTGGGGGSGGTGGGTQPPTSNNPWTQAKPVVGAMGEQQARTYLNQIETLRHQEWSRVGQTLVGMDRLIRGMTGLPGRKDVLWVTEDLMIHPGLDLYQVFFTKFSSLSQKMTIVQPELWATERELLDEFWYIADVSQIAGTVLHVVDASDRDREAANTGSAGADPETQWVTDQSGRGATAGYDFTAMRSLEEGSAFLAQATGGSMFGSSRNFDEYFEALGRQLDSYYFIGYRRPGPADGKVHNYSVRLTRDDLQVRTHERVPNPTDDQRLADIAVSRLLINEGPNPLQLEVSLGQTEPAEGDRYIQEIRLAIPARNLLLAEEGADQVGVLAVAVVAADADGVPLPARLVQLTVRLPAERVTASTVAMARLRLLVEKASSQVAVAVRDQRSGTEASALVETGA